MSKLAADDIGWLAEDDGKGYLLEVDVKYPKELRNPHNDLPFMCKKMVINGVEKLVPNLYDKIHYIIYIKALSQVLKHGLILEKVHREIEFNHFKCMAETLQTQAKNDFEKSFLKLMNNTVFGKTMENIRKHKDINS